MNMMRCCLFMCNEQQRKLHYLRRSDKIRANTDRSELGTSMTMCKNNVTEDTVLPFKGLIPLLFSDTNLRK